MDGCITHGINPAEAPIARKSWEKAHEMNLTGSVRPMPVGLRARMHLSRVKIMRHGAPNNSPAIKRLQERGSRYGWRTG